MSETKSEKFIRLAEARVPKAMDAIRLVGQLSSANYASEEDARQEIVGALQGAVTDVAEKFGVSQAGGGTTAAPEASTETVEDVPQQAPVSFPDPVVFTDEEMAYDGPINADDVRSAIRELTYSKNIDGALQLLRNALSEEPRNEPVDTHPPAEED